MIKDFIKEARHELSQVTWLTRKQAIVLSSVTVVFVFLSAVFIGGVDLLLNQLYNLIN